MNPAEALALPRQALADAARWHALFCSGEASEADHQAWQHWHAADPAHQRAWHELERLQQQLSGLPPRLTRNTLSQAEHQRQQRTRRTLIRGMALLTVGVGLGGAGLNWSARQHWSADYRTALGEQRQELLPDGTRITLNTDTALDLLYSDSERRLRLHRGEVYVETAADPRHRPFLVDTLAGQVEALGTRFSVHQQDPEQVRVAVQESAVKVQTTAPLSPLRLNAGQQVLFTASHLGTPSATEALAFSWTRGTLIAVDWPLEHLLQELSRYRPGWLGCDPTVADYRVSGAFPLHDTDAALQSLEEAFPVIVHQRTRYWVRVLPRS